MSAGRDQGNRTARSAGAAVVRSAWFSALWTLLFLSCERATIAESTFQPVVGYQITGRIVDRYGVPMEGVEIYPYYDLVYESSEPAPPRQYFVQDSVTFVSTRVLDGRDSVVRELGEGWFARGFLLAEWDRRDGAGGDVPSGIYRVCYVVRDDIVHSYSVLVEGTLSARSDYSGIFTLWDQHLPMEFSPVPLFSADSSVYYGTYSIGRTVILDLVTPTTIHTIAVRPSKGRVTDVPLVLD